MCSEPYILHTIAVLYTQQEQLPLVSGTCYTSLEGLGMYILSPAVDLHTLTVGGKMKECFGTTDAATIVH
jgi:hypothetical protein